MASNKFSGGQDAILPEYANVHSEDVDNVDDELADFIDRSGVNRTDTGYESVTALSALSRQMSAYPTLTAAEQRERMRIYQEGMNARAQLGTAKKLRANKERELTNKVKAGEDAQMELIGSMFRLVMLIARELSSRRFGREKSLAMLEDLVAEANLELVEALHRVNTDKVSSFSAYAGRVARDRVRASLNDEAHIQVPSAWLRVNSLAATRIPELTNELGRRPTTPEIQEALLELCYAWARDHLTAEQLKLPSEQQDELMRAKLVKQGMLGAIERYEEVVAMTRTSISMDAPVGDEGSSSVAEVYAPAAGDRDSVHDEVEAAELAAEIHAVLDSLDERERDIILRRFGWHDGETWTYARLAPLHGISAERVRQIEAAVLARLRGPEFSQLGDYLPGR